MISVSVNGTVRQVEAGTTAAEVIGDPEVVAVRIDGRMADLTTRLEQDCSVEPVRFDSDDGRHVFWHSGAHLMAQAVKELYPRAKITIGPAVPEGFYYDFDVEPPFTDDDLPAIEARMREIADRRLPVRRRTISRDDAVRLFSDMGETYKVEIVRDLPDETVTVYEQDGFVDLCRGPHVPNTGVLKAVKLLSVAGAYWHGDERNRMLSRVYGIAFPDDVRLKAHLDMLEEAKRRDHRKLGPALDLFSFHEEAGAGLAFWHPKGAIVRRLIQQYWEQEHLAFGYQLVVTPHIARAGLWRKSGHFDYYRENMYVMPVDNEEMVVKPMNCPGHMLIYRSKVHSYRDLPLRMAEWGTVYRHERSGVLHGMMRVRGFTQDDAHIFCTAEQVEDEVFGVVSLSLKMLKAFGFEDLAVDLSVRDLKHKDKYLGEDEQWVLAEGALVRVLERLGLRYRRAEGEAVFYGPKIDMKLADSLGRQFQCSTCQFDFNLGNRFDLYYMGRDGQHHPVYLVHRTVLGGIERFMGILVEHYAGAFPTWLAPVQVKVLSVAEGDKTYAREVGSVLGARGVRFELDLTGEKINYKIAEAERQKVPFMLVVGSRETRDRTVSVRRHGKGNLGAVPLEAAMKQIEEESNIPTTK